MFSHNMKRAAARGTRIPTATMTANLATIRSRPLSRGDLSPLLAPRVRTLRRCDRAPYAFCRRTISLIQIGAKGEVQPFETG